MPHSVYGIEKWDRRRSKWNTTISGDIIDKVNVALAGTGWKFEDDGEPHDGYEIYTLKRID